MPFAHHETVVDGVTVDHNQQHTEMAKEWNRHERLIPFLRDGSDETALLTSYIDDATPGDALVLPRGPVKISPVTIAKQLHIRGAGRFSSWFYPASDTTDPLITVDTTVDSGHGIFGNYGPVLEGFGIDRSVHNSGPCLHTTPNAAHMTYRDVLCSGGTIGCEHHAPNALMDGLHLWDASDAMLDMDETGLEVHMRYVVMAANVQDVTAYWRVTISPAASGSTVGGIYVGDVSCRSDPAMTVSNGLVLSADSLTEVPTFCGTLVVDNVNGGGPVIDLVNVQSVGLKGWANGTAGAVRMDGCAGIDVEMRTRGGTHTYEFVGDSTAGFKSRSEVFTGPAYKITGTAPTETDLDDWVAGATTIAQVTNNATWFLDAGRRAWRSLRLQGMLRQREAGASPPQGFGTLVPNGAGSRLVVNHPNVQANTRIIFWRETTGTTGTPGELMHDVADNIASTSFMVKSTSTSDTGRVGWRYAGDAD